MAINRDSEGGSRRAAYTGPRADLFAMVPAQAIATLDRVSRNLRFGDRGGGRLNRLLNRYGDALARLAPVREFLTYQFCIRARRRQARSNAVAADVPRAT